MIKEFMAIALFSLSVVSESSGNTAHTPDIEEAILIMTGVGDLSQLPSEELESFMEMAERPLRINRCSRAALLDSGLFSEYQVAAVLDWRARHGDILSVEELGVIDGFGQRVAEAAGRFVSFAAGRLAGAGEEAMENCADLRVEGTILGAVKEDNGVWSGMGGAKTTVRAGIKAGAIGAAVATRGSWDSWRPESIGWSLNWENGNTFPSGTFRPRLTSAVIGSFNARFGQGLLCWSGTTIESYTSPQSLMRRPSGLVPYRSWSPSYAMSGACFRLDSGPFCLKTFIDTGPFMTDFGSRWQGCGGGGCISWNHRNGQIGINMIFSPSSQGYSVDFQQTVQSLVLYGEVCHSHTTAALLGAAYQFQTASLGVRTLYTACEHNITTAVSYDTPDRLHHLNIGTTNSYYPAAKGHTPAGAVSSKTQGEYTCTTGSNLSFSTRATVSCRSLTRHSNSYAPWASSWPARRYELRQDIGWTQGRLSVKVRLDGVRGESYAGMGYMELGYLGSYLQAGLFCADNWNDRIYTYMRDTPGGFSVPALYGRGWWTSVYSRIRLGNHWAIYLRALYTAYPWARAGDTHNTPALNIKFQLTARY